MKFNRDLEIFQQHFPEYSLFPGALLLDYVLNQEVEEKNILCNYYSIQFLKPLLPDQEFEIDTKKQQSQKKIDIIAGDALLARIKMESKSERIAQKPISFSARNHEVPRHPPISKHGEKIEFLDRWSVLEKNAGEITAAGEFLFNRCSLEFLQEILRKPIFGQIFLLIEFMGLTALSCLSEQAVLNRNSLYGFARLLNIEITRYAEDGEPLNSYVTARKVGDAFVWKGGVYHDDQMILSVQQGINLPLK